MERMKRDTLNEMSSCLKTLKFYYIFSSLWIGLLFCYPSYTGRLWKNRSNTSVPIPGLYCLPHDKSSCSVKTPLDLKYLSFFSLPVLCDLLSFRAVLYLNSVKWFGTRFAEEEPYNPNLFLFQ